MNKKLLALSLPLLGLGLIGGALAATASAHGFGLGMGFGATAEERAAHQSEMFAQHAELLGISAEDVKNAWAEGKNLRELAEEKGITTEQLHEKMQAARKAEMTEHLSELVAEGAITQAQADERLAWMNERMTEREPGDGPMGGKGRGGHRGGGMGMGFGL